MKFKKGSVVIYVLALMLVTAGYWNYVSNEAPAVETVSATINSNKDNTENTVDENLGDATLVSNNEIIEDEEETTETSNSENSDDYFEEAKLSRDTMYSQTLETYQGMINNSNVSEEQKTIVTQEITKLNQEKNAIMICEKIIETKGFKNSVIFINMDSVSVIVEAEELGTDEIAQIQNVISRELTAKIENIHIMTK